MIEAMYIELILATPSSDATSPTVDAPAQWRRDTWRPQQRRFWEEPKFFLVYNIDTRCFVLAQLHFNAYCNNPHHRAFIQEGNFKKNYQEYQTQLIKKKASNNEKSILRVMGFNKKN